MRTVAAVLAFVLAAQLPANGTATTLDPYVGTWESLSRHPLPDWWRDAKFGIFIHWGPYSVPAHGTQEPPIPVTAEWYWLAQQVPGSEPWRRHLATYGPWVTYDDLIPRFTADRYAPEAWADLMKDAGARYFLLTTKHHDGFALYPSATTRRDAADMGPRRDLVGPLVEAARDRGLKVGLYYSVPEFFNPAPDGPIDPYTVFTSGFPKAVQDLLAFRLLARNAYTQLPVPYAGYTPVRDYAADHLRPQLREIISRYNPDVLWCDIGASEPYVKGNETIAWYYNRAASTNPAGVVVDDRCGDRRTWRDYPTFETAGGPGSAGPGEIGPPGETVRTMGASWGYDAGETDSDYIPAGTLIGELVTSVAFNANYVLNIGPRADGTIPEPMSRRLREIGDWLSINGQAIYGSRPWSTGKDGDTRFTVGADGALYATALAWPGRELRINAPVPTTPGTRITLLGGDGQPLRWHKDGSSLVVETQATRSRHAYVFRIAPDS